MCNEWWPGGRPLECPQCKADLQWRGERKLVCKTCGYALSIRRDLRPVIVIRVIGKERGDGYESCAEGKDAEGNL